jgi:HemY protein
LLPLQPGVEPASTMRGVVWLIVIFTAAVVSATVLGSNDGLVTIAWGAWRVELSLNLFVALAVATTIALMFLLRSLDAVLSLPRRAGEWRALQRERGAQAALREAQAEYFGARYSRANKAALRALAIQDDTPGLAGDVEARMLAQLIAAGSLHRLQDTARRDEMVRRIDKTASSGAARTAGEGARLLMAEWALDDRDAEQALRQLSALPPGVARRTQALRLRLRAAQMAKRPLEALTTARLLAKHQAFSPVAARGLLRTLAIEVLETAHDSDQLRREWVALDPADRRDAAVTARAAELAAGFGAHDDARAWLAPFWDRLRELGGDERERIALALCVAIRGAGIDWLPRAEAATAALPGEPSVAAAAGMVFAERQLWGKARRLLEMAASSPTLDSTARRRCWRLLATLARQDDDQDRAAACERAAAALD